jgi:hypothetical protein
VTRDPNRENQKRDRAKDQPGLHMAAQEACVTMYTNGFCVARNNPTCTRCWPAAEAVIKATGMSARAVTWIFAHRSKIEEAAKREYDAHFAFDPKP